MIRMLDNDLEWEGLIKEVGVGVGGVSGLVGLHLKGGLHSSLH